MRRFLHILSLVIDVVAIGVLITTAYAGMCSPISHSPLWGVLPLAFPFMVWLVVLLMLIQLFCYRIGAAVCGLGLLVCLGPILDYCPLHIASNKVPQGATTFTLMSYNVHQFVDRDDRLFSHMHVMDSIPNPQMAHILAVDPDIVCLQEACAFVANYTESRFRPEQLQTLYTRYPHIIASSKELVVFSKYPVEAIHLANSSPDGAQMQCVRVTLPDGRNITLFNIHMTSLRLTAADREAYRNVTELQREDKSELKEIVDKIGVSARERAQATTQLMRYIRLYGGPDVIVTGDFNDVCGCNSLRTLADAGFRSVHADVSFGPIITFNSDRMLFGIDHTLYRGALQPVDLDKGPRNTSDHYPILSTFYIAGR